MNAVSLAIAVLVALGCVVGWLAWHLWRLATELARERERVRAQAAEIDAMLAGMLDGILVVDAEMRVMRWNARFCEIAGVPPDCMRQGMPLADALRLQAQAGEFGDVDVEAEVARRIDLLWRGNSFGAIERMRPNGRVMELRRSRLDDGGFVTVYTDITRRRRAEEQLRQSQKMEAVGQLTSGIAHDFNNLLSVIMGNLDLSEHTLGRSDLVRAQRHIDSARGASNRAVALTQRLLAFSRQQQLAPTLIEVNKVVAGMSELLRQSIGSDNHLETVLAGEVWEAVADINQLENALLNLTVNARDAVGTGGKITIETANTHLDAAYASENEEVTPGQFVMIAVSDDGAGMTPEQVRRAFEPFYTTKEVGKGSGLGLSQVFGFIKQSGGHVKIYSEPGVGTTVKLYLPRARTEQPSFTETDHRPPAAAPARARANERVLVVEDDPDVLTFSQGALEALGYEVVAAKDAASALLALQQRPGISLLFTDVELPDQSGPALAQTALRSHPSLSVLFTTGYTINDIVHRGMLEPGAGVLSKPYTLVQLANSVREALDVEQA